MKHLISPSILSADFANLKDDVDMINRSNADWFHVDIMDGVFVPNISFGFPVLSAINRYAMKPLDVHLMIVEPDRYLQQFRDYGAHNITVHFEACTHLHRTIQAIKDVGCKAGVALNPHTPVAMLSEVIEDLDLVLIMSVNPGFGGQQFIENTYQKIRQLKALAAGKNDSLLIEVDGGINLGNAGELLRAGTDVLVAGNAIFSAKDPEDAIDELKNISVSNIRI
ncbi:ribulose-phosphate 3-epimerase [Albibacterium sp.]|uniref:ribulose-phosphate 3-epimerase n=1 Tax=Albibacterium sp. TaxID=2952885 RepID=UPI002C376B07|nr:ribulose-phosphate 3-epimerase [Albibacterium sp.]HUH18802.1 ribulose-phosphate 3-epimerase [Albibacterium sp.]